MERTMKMFYGNIPMPTGIVSTELANKIHAHHIADKINHRKKLSIDEREELRIVKKKTPKHFIFNQKFKLA